MFIRTVDSLSPYQYLPPTPASKWWSVVSILRQTLTGDRRFESRLLQHGVCLSGDFIFVVKNPGFPRGFQTP